MESQIGQKISKVLVLGGGSAGLLAALAVKHRNPKLQVRVVASKKRGTIGVGEGTVPKVVSFIHNYLGFDEAEVYQALDPVYKLGVRFDWGKADYFDYSFTEDLHIQSLAGMSKVSGYFVGQDSHGMDLASSLMNKNFALPTRGAGKVDVPPAGQAVAWHLENHRFVSWLEKACKQRGIKMIDAEVEGVTFLGEGNIEGLKLENGAVLKADLFVDSSGFASRLLGQELEESFESFSDALFCDRALVGGWDRDEGEAILPYTVSQTMQAGWSWRIDHPERVNRGYVYSSSGLTADEAEAEFRAVNPKLGEVREVRFDSGRRSRVWVRNVVGIGNAVGFVEPLEATAIMCACSQAQWLADGLADSRLEPPESMKKLYNKLTVELWDEIRDFLAMHYKFNDKLDTDFWRMCRAESPLGQAADLVEFYKENGPSSLGAATLPNTSPFGVGGYYALLLGMRVKGSWSYTPTAEESKIWSKYRDQLKSLAEKGMTMGQARAELMSPETWRKMRA